MRKMLPLLFLLVSYITAQSKDGNGNTVKASLTAVIVYKSGAEMDHVVKADLMKGNNELIIENISNTLDINSVQVNCNGNITVMGVEFNTDWLQNEIKTPIIIQLEDSVENLNNTIEKLRTNINITTELLSVLKANKEIKGTQTGLSVSELMKLMEYYKTKSVELQNELASFKKKEEKLTNQLARVNNQIHEEQKRNTKKTGRLVLQLNCAIEGKYDFTIAYITPNAYWTPFYDLKADNIKSPLKLVYRAKIFQTTGIDWKQVKLSLSTSIPSQTGNAPLFSTWFLSYINPVRYYDKALAVTNTIQSFNEKYEGRTAGLIAGNGAPGSNATMVIRGAASINSNNAPLYIVNGIEMTASEVSKLNVGNIKNIEILKDVSSTAIYGSRATNGVILLTLKDGLDDYVTVSDKELNVVFDIDLPYDVPTNGKAQTAVLKEYEVPCRYKFYAASKLDKDVFLLAEIADWEKLNLLPGEANIIFENTYIGKSFIDPSSTQDTLNLTMGKDKRVVLKREKLVDYSSVKFLGSNKKQVFTYEITVKNNKADSIDIIVKDQYPVSQYKEVEVELLESTGAMINAETGVVTWKLNMGAGETKKIRISYSIKYPKDKALNL